MPKGWINKKSAQHFTLVHRPQNDPRIHDESAPSMVLNPTNKGSSKGGKGLSDLASELGSDAASMRENEGEAAEYGIYYDDTEYDYMQHLRDLNAGGGESVWVEAEAPTNKGKGKQTQSLEDALREMEVRDKSSALFDQDVLPTQGLPKLNYQSQQDVPDAIAGLQPDMDPRLREVLEALDDEAYVDDQDDDLFQELSKNTKEISQYEFEDQLLDEDDDGWESDGTAKPNKEYNDPVPQLVRVEGEATVEDQNENWMEDFKKFKKDQKDTDKPRAAPANPSEIQSSIWTTTTSGGRKKKRKGALTNPSSYSMTSSAMVRTEQLSFLDARFDRIEEEYTSEMGGGGDDDGASMSEVSTVSSVQGPMRNDLDGILDDFLGNYTKPGKRTSKKTRAQTGIEQLDEIRRGLGPARFRTKGKA